MTPFQTLKQKLFCSTVGRKLIMGLSGLGLVGFIIMHLLGNLSLYSKNPEPFNRYTKALHDLGFLLILAELGLIAFFIFHIVIAIKTSRENKKARPQGYALLKTKLGPSMNTPLSRGMIWSGLFLLLFLIIHIKSFKYGPNMAQGYVTQIDGVPSRDLYRLVVEKFSDLTYVIFYVVAMILLGLHLRHGFWSAFQSLGILSPTLRKTVQVLAFVVAIVLAVGFLFIPIWIYFTGRALS